MHIIFHCHLFLITTHKPSFAVVFPFSFYLRSLWMCLNFISLRFPLLDCGILLLSPHSAHQPQLPFLRAALQPSPSSKLQ